MGQDGQVGHGISTALFSTVRGENVKAYKVRHKNGIKINTYYFFTNTYVVGMHHKRS